MNQTRLIILVLFYSFTFTSNVLAIDNRTEWMYLPGLGTDIPSARANGLGQAYTSIADDLAANIINPAGLALNDKTRFAINIKYRNWYRSYSEYAPDDTLWYFDKGDDLALSYLAFATPIFNKRAYISAFIHEQSIGDNNTHTFHSVTRQTSTKIRMRDYGIGVAVPLFDRRASIGLAISYTKLKVDNKLLDDPWLTDINHQNFSDEVTIRLGALFHINNQLTVGASANFLPKFKYKTQYIEPGVMPFVLDQSGLNNCTFTNDITTCDNYISLPNSYSLGLSYRPTEKWLFTIEGKYIQYSDLMDNFRTIDLEGESRNSYKIDDAWQLHFGTEYRLQTAGFPIALRIGYYNDEYKGLVVSGNVDPINQYTFAEREDIHHFTFGIGTEFAKRFSVDFALDYSKEKYQLALTTGFAY